MLSPRLFSLLQLALVGIVISSCSGRLWVNKGNHLNVFRATYYKSYPGMEDSPPTFQLSIALTSRHSIRVDSVLFKGNTVVPKTNTHNDSLFVSVVIAVADARPNNYASMQLNDNDALIFYTTENKHYCHQLKNITEKAPIYLP